MSQENVEIVRRFGFTSIFRRFCAIVVISARIAD
jgi:hypothetical protein